MARSGNARDRLVDTAMRLFGRRGYAATGLNEIVAKARAPKGSLYHYFPDGKDALGAEAVTRAATMFAAVIEESIAESKSGAEAVRRLGNQLAAWMEETKFRDGSPLVAVALEMAALSVPIRRASAAGLAHWQGLIAAALVRDGHAPARACDLAAFAVATLEGAMIQARAEASAAPLRTAAKLLAEMLRPRAA